MLAKHYVRMAELCKRLAGECPNHDLAERLTALAVAYFEKADMERRVQRVRQQQQQPQYPQGETGPDKADSE